MGGCQSKPSATESSQQKSPQGTPSASGKDASLSQRSKKASHQHLSTQAKTPPKTRKRTDSWANPPPTTTSLTGPNGTAPRKSTNNNNNLKTASSNDNNNDSHADNHTTQNHSHASTATTTSTTTTPRIPTEGQWKYLWQMHSPHLVDPVDVPAVLDMLVNQTINQLSSVQVTWLLRKVRNVVSALPAAPNNKAVLAKLVSTTNSHVGDARTAAEKLRVLHPMVWQKVIPVASWYPTAAIASTQPRRSSSNSNLALSPTTTTTNPTDDTDSNHPSLVPWNHRVLHNLEHMLLHLSDADWERVALAASHAAESAELEMDVNKRGGSPPMPRPSAVPEITEPTTPPPGVTFQALACLTALAVAGTRPQKLQLLFYLCVPNLGPFLSLHEAGGAPVWLLEVGHETVVSLASLTHYHYYGTAYLPSSSRHTTSSNNKKKPKFVASQSRQPLQLDVRTLHSLLLELGSKPAETDSSTTTTPPSDGEPPHLQQRLQQHAAAVYTREVRDAHVKIHNAIAQYSSDSSTTHWSLQEYDDWMNQVVDDTYLEFVLYRLFAAGTVPMPVHEAQWVSRAWEYWYQHHRQLTTVEPTAIELTLSSDEKTTATPNGVKIDGNSTRSTSGNHNTNNNQAIEEYYSQVWGGLGGVDGGGGAGYGVLYCLEQRWWKSWTSYVGWSWRGDPPGRRRTRHRPKPMSNGYLICGTNDADAPIPGTLGFYETMKHGLTKGRDYVLVPPGVWNVLYELYGGGPPLPRMIQPPSRRNIETPQGHSQMESSRNNWADSKATEGKEVDLDEFVQQLGNDSVGRVSQLPESISVVVHPSIIHVQLCDPQQPYKRGETGLASIRVMVIPEQPLWRLFAEIISRFSLQSFKISGPDGRGQARLWRRIDAIDLKQPALRYGPWNLLCKSRHAVIPGPLARDDGLDGSDAQEVINDWRAYTDSLTVGKTPLANGDRLMLEFAVQSKQGGLIWPREAAAKAGRVRRLIEEENEFRRILQGLDSEGNPMVRPHSLVGMDVDAMDSTGRWYSEKILAVEIVDEDSTDEEDDRVVDDAAEERKTTSKRVKIDFADHGGHIEWIDIESDRLGPAGRFTNEAEQQASQHENGTTPNGESKPKTTMVVKKNNANSTDSTELSKLCTLPGYGACGLSNLGNTCYMNSALQCTSYLPLLRAYLISGQYKATGDLNKDNPLGTGGKFLEESAELMKAMWSARMGEKSPTRFKSQLGKVNPQFSGADQQDAQEFLNYMLDVLHEDSNRVRKKPYVEALEDDYVKRSLMTQVGEEAWRRFLRRNRSVVADVAMGQVLNTVKCPICSYSSRNFDPFNLLSIPIPTVADVVFQCTLYRRATAVSCSWVLNRSRKGNSRSPRFQLKSLSATSSPPSEAYIAEQYIVTVSRLADSGKLRVQLQNLCGIPAANLRLCRTEEISNADFDHDTVLSHHVRLISLTDKEGPCSQLAKKRGSSDEDPSTPTQIVAFETTLRTRPLKEKGESSDDKSLIDDIEGTSGEQAEAVARLFERYGDDQECRLFDSDPVVFAKQISRLMWPESQDDFHLGLRVDAKDHRGNWFVGSVVAVFDEEVDGGDADTGTEIKIKTTKVTIHFDNFLSKWDETYTIDHFREGQIKPLLSHAAPRTKPTEFIVYNRFNDASGSTSYFGLPFYVQCRNEWTNTRAAAQILAQASRFLHSSPVDPADKKGLDALTEKAVRASRIYEKTHNFISDLIDILIEYDREYLRLSLGLSSTSQLEGNENALSTKIHEIGQLSASLRKILSERLGHLPFEIKICSLDPLNEDRSQGGVEEELFPFSLIRTIGNFTHARNAFVLQWRASPKEKSSSVASPILSPVMYVHPPFHLHRTSTEYMKASKEDSKSKKKGDGGMDIGVCLKEFCKEQKLSLSDNWRCPQCKDFREGIQSMNLWRLPDLLTFHIKRFNMSARWREKITTKVDFPLTGLDMSEWCHRNSPVLGESADTCVYDLVGVVNHYGSMTGGHYVATCRVSSCGKDGREEVSYPFNGVGVSFLESEESEVPTGWRLGRPKVESNQGKVSAAVTAKAVAESAEPMWLQFDDELVESIPPDTIVSEMAYVLFYRRRQISASNIARYSTLE